MIVSYNWLQRFFDEKLPSPEVISDKLTFGVFEIEGTEQKGDDTIFDVKVLPDRACYALSHRGIAREVATLCELPMKDPLREPLLFLEPKTEEINCIIYDTVACPFYSVALVRGISVGPSPEWLKNHLESIGQKSINNIVDATNFVMFDLGTPIHTFDADKLSGSIGVRAAKDGEKITLLGGEEKKLISEMTVVVDGEKNVPIAIAGVKGGAHAELTADTENIIIEVAKFDPARTRRAASALNLKTDSSKRFENDMAVELPAYGMNAAVRLILEIAGGELVGYATTPVPRKIYYKLGTSAQEINNILGTNLSEDEAKNILSKFEWGYEHIQTPVSKVVEIVKQQLGKPYKVRASVTIDAPESFDCSSLFAYAYEQSGVSIPRISVDQYLWGTPIEKEKLIPGDLIFFNTEGRETKVWYESVFLIKNKKVPEGVSHVVMYIGNGECIHARKTSGKVVQEKLFDIESRAKLVGYRRMAEERPRFVVSVPFERLDLRLPVDIIEEIGRVYGYDKIDSTPMPKTNRAVEIDKKHFWSEKIRGVLHDLGFTEVYTYSLQDEGGGEIKLANALASDKAFLRGNLTQPMNVVISENEYWAPAFGLHDKNINVFEIGNVFTKSGEETHVCISGNKDNVDEARGAIEEIGISTKKAINSPYKNRNTSELSLSDLPEADPGYPELQLVNADIQYKPLSQYPFVLRDVALWVSEGTYVNDVEALIQKNGSDALVRIDKFDEFSKDGRTSYAFHLVFQSHEKTLSDVEINAVMDGMQLAMKDSGWEVR